MKPYIFMERNDIHIIDLMKTERMLEDACKAARQLARSGRKILFVGTKKQAKEIIVDCANQVDMPYATERWLGGMLTNFVTVRKSIKKMQQIEKMELDGTFELIQKRERLSLTRSRAKLEKVLKGIESMNRLPSALFVVDSMREHLAIAEARKLAIPTIAIVDTNCDPNIVDFPIPGNDDAAASIQIITQSIVNAIKEGMNDRQMEKEIAQHTGEDEASGGDEE
jgi:small subunit ribosomal protein S2